MPIPITAFYASLLAVVMLYLAILVVYARRKHHVGLGDGGNKHLQRLIRSHANFTEYVPMALILLLIAELNEAPIALMHFCGTLLILGRLTHAYGVRHHSGYSWQRLYGEVATFAVIGALAYYSIKTLYINLPH